MELILLTLWGIRTGASLLAATYYWQLKEYRWDRMREFLSTQQTASVFLSPFQVILLVFLLLYLSLSFFSGENPLQQYLVPILGTLFLAESLQFAHQVWKRQAKRPQLTTKAMLILGVTFAVECLILLVAYVAAGSRFELTDLVLYLGILALVDHDINAMVVLGVLNPISFHFKKRLFQQAAAKRLELRHVKVVGITGSYGKTSVKEYLSHVLEGKFDVLKTDKNTNTEIGITHTILKQLQPKHQVFVCEMGAYKKGEIAVCCRIARPDIGIFTGLNDQHVALFGSVDKTFAAKWELFSSLNEEGFAVFNADAQPLRERLKPFKGKSVLCRTDASNTKLSEIKVYPEGLSFVYKGQFFESGLIGRFQVVNLLMVIEAAEKLGMSLDEIAARIETLKSPDQTMRIEHCSKGVIIDDGYNVNTDGLKVALSHMDHFEDSRKVVFFPGVLELGENTEKVHEELGESIGKHADFAFLTDESFSAMVSRGALRSGMTRAHIFQEGRSDEIIKQLNELFEEENDETKWVFLFESRGSEKVMEYLKQL